MKYLCIVSLFAVFCFTFISAHADLSKADVNVKKNNTEEKEHEDVIDADTCPNENPCIRTKPIFFPLSQNENGSPNYVALWNCYNPNSEENKVSISINPNHKKGRLSVEDFNILKSNDFQKQLKLAISHIRWEQKQASSDRHDPFFACMNEDAGYCLAYKSIPLHPGEKDWHEIVVQETGGGRRLFRIYPNILNEDDMIHGFYHNQTLTSLESALNTTNLLHPVFHDYDD